MAGLVALKASVFVGPPFAASGSSCGSVLVMSPVPVSAQVVPLSRLWPCDVNTRWLGVVAQLPAAPAAVLPDRIEFRTVEAVVLNSPPPPPAVTAVLPAMVELLICSEVELLEMPPPELPAVLPAIVEESMMPVPPLTMPPPADPGPAWFPRIELALIVADPPL